MEIAEIISIITGGLTFILLVAIPFIINVAKAIKERDMNILKEAVKEAVAIVENELTANKKFAKALTIVKTKLPKANVDEIGALIEEMIDISKKLNIREKDKISI